MKKDLPVSNEDENVKISEKKHIGNIKLSDSKKAIKLHIFETNKFYVIPIPEFKNKVGKIFEYTDGISEVVGEFSMPKKNEKFWQIKIGNTIIYSIRDTYIQLMLNMSDLCLKVYDE